MRSPFLASVLAVSLGAALHPERTIRPSEITQGPCEMDASLARRARSLVEVFLTDTAEAGATFEATRIELGVVGVRYAQVEIVQDTIKCRAAINSFKSLYATYGQEEAAKAARIDNGMLFRLTPNRFILAIPYFDPFLGLSYVALDSNAVVVRSNL